MSIFSARSKSTTTPEEAPVTTTDTPTPPALYGGGSDWQEEGTYAVPAELREAYSEAVPRPEVELAREEGKGKGLRVARLFPPAEAARLAANNDGQEEVPEVREDGWRRFWVPVSPEEWLHVRRMEKARKLAAQEPRTEHPLDRSTCVACGATAPARSDEVRPRIGAPYRLGIRGALCGACADTAVVVLAEQRLASGETRHEAVMRAAGLDESMQSRADQDREAVLTVSTRG